MLAKDIVLLPLKTDIDIALVQETQESKKNKVIELESMPQTMKGQH